MYLDLDIYITLRSCEEHGNNRVCGGLIHKPLLLNEYNFGQWKVRMKQQLRGIEEDVWNPVETRWTNPMIYTADDEKILKPKNKWTKAKKTASKLNAKALS